MMHFKRWLPLACLILPLQVLLFGDDPDEGVLSLSLDSLSERIEAENPRILLNREAIEQAIAERQQRRSKLLPEIDLRALQQRSRRPLSREGAQGVGSINDFHEVKAVGELTLFDARNFAEWRAAEAGIEVSRQAYQSVFQEILFAAFESYLTHLRDLDRMEVINANIERDKVLLELARRQLDAGVATEIDLTRAEVSLARNMGERLRARTEVLRSELTLRRLLNIDASLELQLERLRMDFSAKEPPFSDLLLGHIEDRPEFREAEERLRQLERAEQGASWQRLPSFSIIGEYGYGSERIFDGDASETWLAGAILSIPVFEGGRISGERREAAARVRGQEFFLRDLRLELERSFRFVRKNIDFLQDQVEVSKEEAALASKEMSLARARFEKGLGDNQEVVRAQAALVAAEDGLVEAIYQYQLGLLQLARESGEVRRFSRLMASEAR